MGRDLLLESFVAKTTVNYFGQMNKTCVLSKMLILPQVIACKELFKM
jgi:hypothetical protein